uniref:C-type lectin domain-containing protein n=1 Tax=Acrobeloides nanus TaxID=290746 RepID=A0A914CLY3_9BILA
MKCLWWMKCPVDEVSLVNELSLVDELFNGRNPVDKLCLMNNECELGWTYFNLTHGCYKVLSNLNFELAQEECSLQKSGSLVSIHNHEENEFVNNLVEKSIKWDFNSNILLTAWIGLHDLTFNKKWRWPDDSMVDYTNWNIGEPNGEFGRESCVETIVRLDKPNPRNPIMSHSWNDIPCSVIRPAAVCKYKRKYCGAHQGQNNSADRSEEAFYRIVELICLNNFN